ncbi:uncharacterized protein BCR38DRAFT_442245 [Pseudomassariella vexata]|uniref:Uncharacterized protein n=1 Tax=Pseudomassariella vexata TaxID=1141098 RepID=A0A1Y2DN30_9PEZI|nr:uncharacterized protein BCR38DRAFT_442245 [Pseudomassariella vexata]ORY60703.1 hypothetical protein BCR38DRAFT_442245 [Pseudomassariella vexata]
MFSSLTTKLALRKAGIKSDTFDFSSEAKPPKGTKAGLDEQESSVGWPAWISTKKLPLTAQAWLSPPPPPIPIAECPKVGDLAPLDRDRQLSFGNGKPVIVVFLRCVGCAFAQKTFLALRTLANRHQGKVTCIAVSHSSKEATRKWMDLLGGAWNVEVVIDEDRVIYAAWGLGLGTVWSMFNPTTQVQGWKEKGWLGIKVADSIQRTGSFSPVVPPSQAGKGAVVGPAESTDGPSTVMGNKWQQAGLFAVDGRGTVLLATKALRADDVMDLDAAATALGLR